jgi:F0F1-type ATP synthase membrane subunit b/b'
MKKLGTSFLVVALLVLFTPFVLNADEEVNENNSTEISKEAVAKAKSEIEMMVNRVMEISEMDMNELTRAEKKELRKEVKSIKKDLKAYSKSESEAIADAAAKGADRGGIYISGGALLIIIILLILL